MKGFVGNSLSIQTFQDLWDCHFENASWTFLHFSIKELSELLFVHWRNQFFAKNFQNGDHSITLGVGL